MASPQLSAAQAGLDARAADRLKAAEIAQRFTGWYVFTTRDGTSHVATRTGNQQPPANDDTWAATVICDRWPDLEAALVEQQQHDVELSSP